MIVTGNFIKQYVLSYVMAKTLAEFVAGRNNVIVADDSPLNIQAARNYARTQRGVHFEFYYAGQLLIPKIMADHSDIGLILVDREMETSDIGLDVLETAWSYHVPAFVCTGGYQHAGNLIVKVAPDGFATADGNIKSLPRTWREIVDKIVGNSERTDSILYALQLARQSGTAVPNVGIGRMARSVAESYLRQD